MQNRKPTCILLYYIIRPAIRRSKPLINNRTSGKIEVGSGEGGGGAVNFPQTRQRFYRIFPTNLPTTLNRFFEWWPAFVTRPNRFGYTGYVARKRFPTGRRADALMRTSPPLRIKSFSTAGEEFSRGKTSENPMSYSCSLFLSHSYFTFGRGRSLVALAETICKTLDIFQQW